MGETITLFVYNLYLVHLNAPLLAAGYSRETLSYKVFISFSSIQNSILKARKKGSLIP